MIMNFNNIYISQKNDLILVTNLETLWVMSFISYFIMKNSWTSIEKRIMLIINHPMLYRVLSESTET